MIAWGDMSQHLENNVFMNETSSSVLDWNRTAFEHLTSDIIASYIFREYGPKCLIIFYDPDKMIKNTYVASYRFQPDLYLSTLRQ